MAERLLPNSRGCFVCGRDNAIGLGLQFTATDAGVYSVITPGHQYEGFPGVLQGGVAAGLMDDAMWYAIFAQGPMTMTAEMTVRYKAPVPTGDLIRIEGRVESIRRSLYQTAARILSRDGKVLMEATGKFLPAPASLVEHLMHAMEDNV